MGLPIANVTLGALLDRLRDHAPEREALVHPELGLRWTFAELSQRADDLARGLLALGIQPGDHVAVWADNRPDWVSLSYAIARVGAVLVTVNVELVKREAAYVLRQSRSRLVVAARGVADRKGREGDEYERALAAIRADGDCPELEHVVAFDALDELIERGRAVDVTAVRARTAAVPTDAPANIQYTSGTTGFPKGVVLTHANVLHDAVAFGRRLDTGPDDRVLMQVPLFHCFGCVIALLGAHAFGAAIVMLRRFDATRALEAIDAERCTLLHGVPTMYLALLEHPERARFDTHSLRAGAMGGAICPPALMRRVAEELGCAGIANAFGLTECSPTVAMCGPDVPLEERIACAGPALDGVEMKAVDPATLREVATGTSGEIWVRGPTVMRGYFEQPDETAAVLTADGWLRTGDLGAIDARGRVTLTGRLKDVIIRGGENVMPAEVEDALRAHPAVRDAAAFGVPSERWGEEVAAAVVLRAGVLRGEPGAADEAALIAFLGSRLARFKRPSRIHVVDELPLTSSGKIRRFVLRERFARG